MRVSEHDSLTRPAVDVVIALSQANEKVKFVPWLVHGAFATTEGQRVRQHPPDKNRWVVSRY